MKKQATFKAIRAWDEWNEMIAQAFLDQHKIVETYPKLTPKPAIAWEAAVTHRTS